MVSGIGSSPSVTLNWISVREWMEWKKKTCMLMERAWSVLRAGLIDQIINTQQSQHRLQCLQLG